MAGDEVVKKLQVIASVFGDPQRIISDKGAAFTLSMFASYCEERDIELHTIVTGVPRGNGQVERVHRTIIPVLTKLSINKPEEWYRHVNAVQKANNSSWQRAIRSSLFELLVGVQMKDAGGNTLRAMVEAELQQSF